MIGDPVRHSRSPAIHNSAYAAMGLDIAYVAMPIAAGRLGSFVDFLRISDMVGVSVTMPHKSSALALVDEVDPIARRLGALNTIVNRNGVLTGYSTDGTGFTAALGEAGITLTGRNVALIGAGGAARAVALAVAEHQPESIRVINRTSEAAEELVQMIGGVATVGVSPDIFDAEVVINATPVGMQSSADRTPVDGNLLHKGHTVVDLIYEPPRTRLLREADAIGATTLNGLTMLVHQAAAQIELWTEQAPPIDALMSAVK